MDGALQLSLPGVPARPKAGPRIAIVGTTPTRGLAPYLDPTWEIWAGHDWELPRWSRWFEIHDPAMLQSGFAALWNWMVEQDGTRPIYMAEAHPDIVGSQRFPRETLPSWIDSMFLTSTVAWELALALSLGASEIGIFGVDMSAEEEYRAQKPGCRALVQAARALGCQVSVPENCELLKPVPTYQLGEQPWRAGQIAARRAALEAELAEQKDKVLAAQSVTFALQGALDAMRYAERNWS